MVYRHYSLQLLIRNWINSYFLVPKRKGVTNLYKWISGYTYICKIMIIIMSYFLVTQKYISYYDNDEKGGKYTFEQ